ncbi:cell envelope integrity protein TolA [Gammaproteobacteria bacterium]|nr:cell envelope integrity protein TolA [Gammaproteobacteria bacterium]|tara:strand:+ start:1894 stop:2721 length:828 start_codon:yes stop_codon:yes gene_type:complete
MNNAFNNLIIYNGYPLSVVVAVVFHILILSFLIWLQSNNSLDSLELVQPTIIKALFIDENPQVTNQRNQERQRLERIDRERIEREQEQQRQQSETDREAERERQRQEERERSALREREELERQRAIDLQRDRDQAEEQRRLEQTEAEQRRIEEEAERRRQQEVSEAAAINAARNEFELVQSATAVIQQAVQQVWNRPPSARNGMRAVLQIRMLPTGELVEARITDSSGDPAFDRSAENAVYSAAPFTELQSLPINIFNGNFRTLSLIFQPEDLLN